MNIKQPVLGFFLMLIAATASAEGPDIAMLDLNGKPRNVNEFIGQGNWTVVVVWARDCLLCNREIPQMAAFHMAYQNKGANVLGISIDGAEHIALAREFVSFHKLPFVNLVAEPEQDVMMKFGAGHFIATPTHYFYDPKGKLIHHKTGPMSQKDVEDFIAAHNNDYAS